MNGKRYEDEKVFLIRQWDDFHDDGSDDGSILASASSFEQAEKILFALTRRFFSKYTYSGDSMVSWTISGPSVHKLYRLEEQAGLADPIHPEDEKILKSLL
jgi:hypothetical protein